MSCPECFTGYVHEGTPTGRVDRVYGKDTYIAAPPAGVEPKGIVLILTDGAGYKFVNTRLLADTFAAEGKFLVYVPDFLGGNAVPPWVLEPMTHLMTDTGIVSWLWKPWYIAKVFVGVLPMIIFSLFSDPWPDIEAFFTALRGDKGKDVPVGVAGYCWGGTYSAKLAHADATDESSGVPLADVSFVAHPGAMAVPADAEKVVRPLSFAIGDKDALMSMKSVEEVKAVFAKKKDEVETEVVVYPGAGHGFGTRCDPGNKEVSKHSEDAAKQAIDWFTTHF